MSEERLNEIKDSVNFQKELLLAHNMNTLCVDEEQELIEEIDRLNNIINELEKWLEERTYGMNEIHTYKIGALEDEVILNKLKALKENNKDVC